LTENPKFKIINTCPSCGNKLELNWFLFKKKKAEYFKCANCNLIYQNPQPVFELSQDIYDGDHYHNRYIQSEYIYFPTSNIYLKEIENNFQRLNYNSSGAKLLDVGCGIGYFLYLTKKKGYYVQGADISKWAGDYAKKHFDVDVITGNFLEIEFKENYYDVITIWQTIEHLPEPGLFLEKIYSILKPGGYLCVATPDTNSWIAKFYKKLWNCYIPDEHICLFNFKSMKIILERFSFNPIVIKRIHERQFIPEQYEYLKLFIIRVIKNIVLKTYIFKPLFEQKIIKRWEAQTDLEIPLPSIAYSVLSIARKEINV
jgi:ubiquinone/menaquinone biosynthesis C-methylase UbiE